MSETRIIRGRRVVFDRKEPVEILRYSIDVFDKEEKKKTSSRYSIAAPISRSPRPRTSRR